MKTQPKNWIIGIIVSFFLIIALMFASNKLPFASGILGGTCDSQTSVLSLGSGSYFDPSENIFHAFVAVTGDSECLKIAWSKDEIQKYLPSGFVADKGSYLNLQLEKYEVNFPIIKTSNYYKYYGNGKLSSYPLPYLGICDANECKNKGYSSTILADRAGFSDCYCLQEFSYGLRGSFQGSALTDFNIRASATGLNDVILSRNQQSAWMGDKIFIKYTGNLVTFDRVNAPQYETMFIQNQWQLVQNGAFASLSSLQTSTKNDWISQELGSNYDRVVNDYNNQFNLLTSSKNSEYINSMISTGWISSTSDTSFETSGLKLKLKARESYPTFTIDIKADWVGIHRLSGILEIQNCPSSFDFKSGASKIVTASINNLGNTKGTFNIGISCDGGAVGYFTGDSRIEVYPNTPKSISIDMRGTSNPSSDKSVSCTLAVSDLNNPDSKDTCVYSGIIRYDPGYKCDLGQKKCSDDYSSIQICDASGKFVSTVCNYGCEYSEGSAKCRENESVQPITNQCKSCDDYAINKLFGGIFKQKQCTAKTIVSIPIQNTIICFPSILRWFVIPIFFILSVIMLPDFFTKIKSINKNKYLVWGLSFLLSGLLSWLFWVIWGWLWWASLLGFIAFASFWGIFKKFIM